MSRYRLACALLGILSMLSAAARANLPEQPPAELGFDPARLERINAAVERAISAKGVPGAAVLVGRHGKIAYVHAFGQRAVEPKPEPMTRETEFDMASLTKPIATATSIMVLIESGKLKLDDTLATLWPEADNHGKGAITLEQLLRHRSGLIPDNPISDYADGTEKAWERIANLAPVNPPGSKFVYSDVNFLILGKLVERISGQPLSTFASRHIFEPLGMADTRYASTLDAPALERFATRTAPTERIDGVFRRGVVHDPRSHALGGVAGHAGLFSTADDLAIYAQTILNLGVGPNGKRILTPATVSLMTSPGDTPTNQKRGLGWDIATGFSSPRGRRFGPKGFGHTGFTGTSIWIDPETDTFVIILTSRLHPLGTAASPTNLRSEIATIVAEAILDESAIAGVRCGVDVLIARNFAPLKGKSVGLITNHTGRARDGRSTIDVLHKAPEVKLVALFSPEHGIRGAVDREVADSRDEATGLTIHSLYGKTRKPTPESLKGVDVLVYDIQDIGARFYTYTSTLGLVLEAAREAGIPLVVLDRPNPIGGLAFGGPVRESEFASFIAHHDVPVTHGMTLGELARMFNQEREINADLTVIPCENWRRSELYDRTGLLWVNPSPNMRSLTEALIYPGVGLLEATNLATGRGTDTPFERVGATYIDPLRFATALNDSGLAGVRFVPIRFSPKERQFQGEDCGGVYIQITDRDAFDPIDLGLEMAIVLRRLYREEWKPDALLKFLCDRPTYQAILDGKDLKAVRAEYEAGLDAFRKRREAFLIYDN